MIKKLFLMIFNLQIFAGGKVFAQEIFICTDDAGISCQKTIIFSDIEQIT